MPFLFSPQQAKIQMMEEVAMRRERRLMFLTKERDGYINVLKSYQVDGSVEQQVKDLQAEVYQSDIHTSNIKVFRIVLVGAMPDH